MCFNKKTDKKRTKKNEGSGLTWVMTHKFSGCPTGSRAAEESEPRGESRQDEAKIAQLLSSKSSERETGKALPEDSRKRSMSSKGSTWVESR